MAVKDWSTTASSNASADAANGINWAEGMSPAQVNDSARAMMAVIKGDFANALNTGFGYQKFPNGLIIQYGKVGLGTSDGVNHTGTVAWPTTFPTECSVAVVGGILDIAAGDPRLLGQITVSVNTTQITVNARNNVNTTGVSCSVMVIGVGK